MAEWQLRPNQYDASVSMFVAIPTGTDTALPSSAITPEETRARLKVDVYCPAT